MTRHIDKFERICGMVAHNNPDKPPTDEDKEVDWFIASVTEKTYDSVHAGCTDKQLDGTLTFARVVKLCTHRCFQKYPHFQLDDLTSDKKESSNNATSFRTPEKGKGRGSGKGSYTGKGRGRGRDRSRPYSSNNRKQNQTPTVIPNQKGKGKAEAKKANRDPDLVPLATESCKIHAAIAILPEPATSVRMTKRMVRKNQHTSKQTSTLPSTRRP
jgi:hypothetical protein